MGRVDKLTISLPAEQAGYIEQQLANGTYASASDVIEAGLKALQKADAAVEQWLHDDVSPVFDAMQADPARAIPADTVLMNLRSHHAAWVAAKRGD